MNIYSTGFKLVGPFGIHSQGVKVRVAALGESRRASQRVDYSSYLPDDDQDGDDMHYSDNILPTNGHSKVL